MNAAELPPQQRPVALLSARQLLPTYCLERSGTVQPVTRAPSLDEPAVLARATICSSVNPLAAPGEIAQSKPNDEDARSCPYAQLSCRCNSCGGCCNPHGQCEKHVKVHSVIPSGAELAAVPPAYLLPRLWPRQRRRRQPKPALLRSCQASCLKKTYRLVRLLSSNAVPLKRSLMAAAAAAPAAAACTQCQTQHVTIPRVSGSDLSCMHM